MSQQDTIFGSMLSEVIKLQHLDNFSQFDGAEFFDEIPFFSRASDVAFLRRLGRPAEERSLVEFSLKYLDQLVEHLRPRSPLLAAITIVDFGKKDVIVPNVFVCHGDVEKELLGQLVLSGPSSAFARRIEGMVEEFRGPGRYAVLQDDLTIPRTIRAFIGRRGLPEPFVEIERFAKDRDHKDNGARENRPAGRRRTTTVRMKAAPARDPERDEPKATR